MVPYQSDPSVVDQQAMVVAARRAIDKLADTQRDTISAAGSCIAEAVLAGGILHAFGTGHSEAVALELVGRAGGLVPTNKLHLRDLVLDGGEPADTVGPLTEREPALAGRLLNLHDVRPIDVFVIASNSGGNGATVEMASLVKRRRTPLIALTSLAHTQRIVSRHPSGLRLFELADVVIDNCAPYGDAVLDTPQGRVCAVSSITSALAAQMMVAEAIGRILQAGRVPPLYVSANTPGADERNRRVEASYANRIKGITA